ncbi:hypothetical protein QYF61_003075 [Mycteria americana]|uniref:Uncharacterized protein n=1 Tax=Mycteria americana TaxID=33587 RepID=A0AAN7RXH5_MYCAM|nr:hypothetical protein QYF61_003075 [Mycteria americana]
MESILKDLPALFCSSVPEDHFPGGPTNSLKSWKFAFLKFRVLTILTCPISLRTVNSTNACSLQLRLPPVLMSLMSSLSLVTIRSSIASPRPGPMLDHPFSKEIFPNIQSKPLLMQLEPISSRPITSYLGEETDPHLSTTSFQVVIESNKVSPQPPFLQAKQPQFPQPLLIRLVLQTLHQLRCPSLDTLQHLNVLLQCTEGPKTEPVLSTGARSLP